MYNLKQLAIYYSLILASAIILVATDVSGLIAESRANPNKIEKCSIVGPLTVSVFNPRYFTDGSGKTIYLTGSHTWNNFQDIGDKNSPPFDYNTYLDFLQKHNHNFIRLWAWEQAAWFQATKEKLVFSPLPYERPGPEKALDGKPKFDLNKFNQIYFDRLRERVIAAQDRGIYVCVMLFQGFSIEIKGSYPDSWFIKNLKRVFRKLGLAVSVMKKNNPWGGHPFNVQNNINRINGDSQERGDGREVHTLNLPQITRLQEEYVKKVVDTLNDLDNVLWEISNESHSESTAWQYHIIDFIHKYEQQKGKKHSVLMTVQWPGGLNITLFNSSAEVVSPNGENGYKDDPPVPDGKKVIISDTDHLWGVGGDHMWVWKSFLRGLNPIFMDPYNRNVLHNPLDYYCDPANPEWELVRKNMGYTRVFAERINLGRMLPQPGLASSGYCLAEKGKEYLIYALNNNGITVDLSLASGKFNVEWFNPLTGASTLGDTATGGTLRPFIPPFDGDAVLYLSR